jgi:hypothetical protein
MWYSMKIGHYLVELWSAIKAQKKQESWNLSFLYPTCREDASYT